MFRQIVAHRWSPDADEDARAAFRTAARGLEQIPEVVLGRAADDAGHFDGNHEFATVLDFPDFAAARRYVADERHQRFVREHAKTAVVDRVVVQYEWAIGTVAGVHHVKLPVTEVAGSRDFWVRAFGFEPEIEFREDGQLRGVALRHRESGVRVALREDPRRAAAMAGFDAVCLAVGTRSDLDAVLDRMDDLDIAHTEVRTAHNGFAADVIDPDGYLVRLHTYV